MKNATLFKKKKVGLIPDSRTSTCCGCGQKKKPFTVVPQNSEILRYKSNKICQMYMQKNIKPCQKIKEDMDKCRDILCSWIGRLKIVKMSVLLKLLCRFYPVPTKSKQAIMWIQQNNYVYMERQNIQNIEHNIEDEEYEQQQSFRTDIT